MDVLSVQVPQQQWHVIHLWHRVGATAALTSGVQGQRATGAERRQHFSQSEVAVYHRMPSFSPRTTCVDRTLPGC